MHEWGRTYSRIFDPSIEVAIVIAVGDACIDGHGVGLEGEACEGALCSIAEGGW
jgi:hypothetical protein